MVPNRYYGNLITDSRREREQLWPLPVIALVLLLVVLGAYVFRNPNAQLRPNINPNPKVGIGGGPNVSPTATPSSTMQTSPTLLPSTTPLPTITTAPTTTIIPQRVY